MFFRASKITLLLFLTLCLVLPNFVGFAQEEACQTREECEALLKKYEEEIKKLEGAIGQTEAEQRTIQNQIAILRSSIQKLDVQIQQGNVMITDLSYQIKDTEMSIEQTSHKIDETRDKLANILQTIYEEDQLSLVEVMLTGNTLSDFFDNLMALETLNLKSQDLLDEIKNLKMSLEGQKDNLATEKGDLERVIQIQSSQKQQSQAARAEQETFLEMTEAQKQQYLREKEEAERMAAEIRERLFRLIGIPDVQAPTFGEAIQIANQVTRVINIRPAFLLGIISAESALGRNVGQCYVTNKETGGGVYISSGRPVNRLMHPTRDLPVFLRITGNNFSQIPVSCWIPICYLVGARTLTLTYNNITIDNAGNIICPAGYAPYGFGGAMGPAQFIPSTWAIYEPKIRSTFGIANPNPWNIYDAFAASALYLHELGANYNETTAANRYSGGYSWYASDVLRRAACIQEFMDRGSMSLTCQQLIF